MLGYKNPKKVIITYACILGAAVLGFIVRLVKFDQFTTEQHFQIFIISVVLITVSWEALRFVNYKLNDFYPFERSITGRITIQLIAGAIIGTTTRFMIYLLGEPHLPFQLDSLFIAATWVLYVILPTAVNFIFFTSYFIDRWKDTIVYSERLQKEKAQVQFDNLKNQLNPHFLFNALTSLNSLIFENQQLASDFLQQLSRVYRYVLQNKEKNLVILTIELEFIENYVRLLETRFAPALAIKFNIHDDAKEKLIVPVTLQILIENAIKHNVVDKHRPLVIDVLTIGDYLVVSNNLQLKRNVEASNKQGLENLKSLYNFLTDKPVIIQPTDEMFFVKIPLL
ncbi:MAG TPA: histidine kinase [Chryseosolibacter sp.]|nr:histidine kinase [Chryseosolibacter sp.]